MGRDLLQRRIAWPRGRHWRPGEQITLRGPRGSSATFRLWGVDRDPDPRRAFATVTLEPIAGASDAADEVRPTAC